MHKFVRHYLGKNQDSPIVELAPAKAANCVHIDSVLTSGSNADPEEAATRSSGTGKAEPHGHEVQEVRPVASTNSLLVAASRCDD